MATGNLKDSFHSKPAQQEIHAFVMAADSGEQAAVRKFLEQYTASIDEPDDFHRTALMAAARNGHSEMVKFLLKSGADINKKDDKGWTALIYIICGGDRDMVELLLENGADLDAKSDNDFTALMLARKAGETETASFLEQWPEMHRRRIAEQKERQVASEIADFSPALKRNIPALHPLKISKRGCHGVTPS